MSRYSEGQTHQLMEALQAKGFTPEEVTMLGQYPKLGDFRSVLNGQAEIKMTEHVINLDADPFVPDGWRVEKHQKGGGLFKWDPKKVRFYLSKSQLNGKVIKGKELHAELEGKPVLNANVLDYLFAHPYLIPEEWKRDERGNTRNISFWGTKYSLPGCYVIRCLYWNGDTWSWGYIWINSIWLDSSPAALRD
ncbi:MAG: hypothetical protein HYY55_04355 [Candidatus Niyogibacteria bacterium]|nr:MAG: hypothetical protein HYY55_04355 [Candidatus Niyogibacteria bacterium]